MSTLGLILNNFIHCRVYWQGNYHVWYNQRVSALGLSILNLLTFLASQQWKAQDINLHLWRETTGSYRAQGSGWHIDLLAQSHWTSGSCLHRGTYSVFMSHRAFKSLPGGRLGIQTCTYKFSMAHSKAFLEACMQYKMVGARFRAGGKSLLPSAPTSLSSTEISIWRSERASIREYIVIAFDVDPGTVRWLAVICNSPCKLQPLNGWTLQKKLRRINFCHL